jgi:hypothetical protein
MGWVHLRAPTKVPCKVKEVTPGIGDVAVGNSSHRADCLGANGGSLTDQSPLNGVKGCHS